MKKLAPTNQEAIDSKLIEDIYQLNRIALGEGPAECQICDRELREGDDLTAYAFRTAGNPIFEIGYVMCGDDEHAHPTEFMRGVDELVATGRIGRCSDLTTQSSWLVLLAPTPIVASRPTTSDPHTIGADTPRTTTSHHTHEDHPEPLGTERHERAATHRENPVDHPHPTDTADDNHPPTQRGDE